MHVLAKHTLTKHTLTKHTLTKIVPLTLAIAIMAFGALSASAAPPAAPAAQEGNPERGAYILSLAGGCGCHMGQAGFLGGGEKFEGPFGVVYASNITPDSETGIGNWSDQEIIDAIRLGEHPGDTQLHPVMPYPTFSNMADQDVRDLVAFLRTVEPVENAVPPRELEAPVPPFEPRQPAPAEAPTEGVDRGAYIVNAIAHCGDCHTPRTPQGAPDMSKMLAGAMIEGQVAPNITPHDATGIGTWSEEEIAALLRTGERPDGSEVGGLMKLSVDGGYVNMTESDALAIAAYLETVPAVANTAQTPEEMPEEMPTTGGVLPANWLIVAGLAAALGTLLLVSGVGLRVVVRRVQRRN